MLDDNSEFDRFWQTYLRYHAQGATRVVHVLGTFIAAAALILAMLLVDPLIAFAGIAAGYLLAWTSHLLVEKNRPAMIEHPTWSFQCDVRMFRLWLTGQLGSELKRAGVG